jgi:hypothetical protein
MMKNKVKILLTMLLLWFGTYSCVAQKIDTAYSRIVDSSFTALCGISLRLHGDFKLTKQQDAVGTRKLEFKSATDFLAAKTWYNISDSMSSIMIDDKKFLIENLFITQPSPYPDAVSNQVECPARLKPAPFDSIYGNIRIFSFRLYANDRYVYGECTDDVIIYTSAYILAYNIKEKTLTEIKYFTPKLKPVNLPELVMRKVM